MAEPPTLEGESANTDIATDESEFEDEEVLALEPPTLELDDDVLALDQSMLDQVLALDPEALATDGGEIVDIANAEFEMQHRMEARRNKHGKLRGIAWRKRNKERKAVWYVGEKSEGQRKAQYLDLKPKFESANTGLEGRNEPPTSVGSRVDRVGGVGDERSTEIRE